MTVYSLIPLPPIVIVAGRFSKFLDGRRRPGDRTPSPSRALSDGGVGGGCRECARSSNHHSSESSATREPSLYSTPLSWPRRSLAPIKTTLLHKRPQHLSYPKTKRGVERSAS